jgi:hypothetical protein
MRSYPIRVSLRRILEVQPPEPLANSAVRFKADAFEKTNVRFGSKATQTVRVGVRSISALPPIATGLMRHSEASLSANCDPTRCSKRQLVHLLFDIRSIDKADEPKDDPD